MILLELAYGEWDDYSHIPFLVTEDSVSATLLEEQIFLPGSDLNKKAITLVGNDTLKGLDVNFREVDFIKL